MTVISFASSKGGAGKTTACIVLGTEISHTTSVAMIDADPQQRLMRWAKKAGLPKTISVVSCADQNKIFEEIQIASEKSNVVLIDLEGVESVLNSRAIGKSDLVIVPMGDEQQDADDAVTTLQQVRLERQGANRDIAARVLFTRVQAAVKAKNEKDINAEMRKHVPCFKTELHKRTGYSALHSYGGTLETLKEKGVNGIDKCIDNAQNLAAEVLTVLLGKENA